MDSLKQLTNEEKDDLRRQMGTLPETNTEFSDTILYKGVTGINVEMFSWPKNWTQIIGEHVVATWGDERFATKWNNIKPELRFLIVKAAATGQTLPQSLEGVSFDFTVRGLSRAAFDQIVRARLGFFAHSQGVRDNSRLDAAFRVPSHAWEDKDLFNDILEEIKVWKTNYKKMLKHGSGSFQSARIHMPMAATHSFKMHMNLAALRGFMSQRLLACEMSDTCHTAILIRDCIKQYSPYIASMLKPRCDSQKRCIYHNAYTLSEMFGCLFSSCGRWKDETPYSTHNQSCSDYTTMGEESGLKLENPGDWENYANYEDLSDIDKAFFNEKMVTIKSGQNVFEDGLEMANKLTEDDKLIIAKLEDGKIVLSKDIKSHVERYL